MDYDSGGCGVCRLEPVQSGWPDSLWPGLEAGLAAAPVDFNLEVRPLLSRSCYPCHGPDEESRKGKLRLDSPAEARRNGTVLAGQPAFPDESEVVARITTPEARGHAAGQGW